MDARTTLIGMDLGAFKTSVANANGHREVMHTVLGRPRDLVARTMFGRDVVLGEEVWEHPQALDIVRPFAKGCLKYGGSSSDAPQYAAHLEAARMIVEHAVRQTHPTPGQPVYGVIGAPSRASVENKQFLLRATEGTFDAVMIVPEPFTVAYGMNSLRNTLVVDIGGGTIDICPMTGSFPREEDQFTVPLGGDIVDETLQRLVQETYPEAELSLTMARQIKERHGFVTRPEAPVIVQLPTQSRPQAFDVTECLRLACLELVEPIVTGIRQVFARLTPEHKQTMLQNVILAGGGSQMRGLDSVVEQALAEFGGGRVRRAFDCVFAGATGALKLALTLRADDWQRIQDVPAAA